MVPLAVIVVVAIIAALALAASAALAFKLSPGRRQAATRGSSTDDDLEKAAEAPTRKVQIRHGRVVSWHSTAKSIKGGILRIPTPKIISSRPSSTLSLPRTIDLENEIQQFRRDYTKAKELEAENPGSGTVKGLVPVSRLETPRPAAARAPVLSAIGESEDPGDQINNSSWETYNGHRQSNDPLSSYLGPFSPSLEQAIEVQDIENALSNVQPPPPARAKSSSNVRSPVRNSSDAPEVVGATHIGMRRSQSEFRRQPGGPAPPPMQLKLDTMNLNSIFAQQSPKGGNAADTKSPSALSIQSAIYKSPIHEVVTAAPQPRKPSKLDLSGNFSKLDYGFPSPPPSSSLPPSSTFVTSPTRASMGTLSTAAATFGEGEATSVADRMSTYSDPLQYGDFMDLESVTTRSPSMCSSRATTRSRRSRSRSSSHRVHKRPPPVSVTEPVPPLPSLETQTPTETEVADTDAYLTSPSASDAVSGKSPKSPGYRKSHRISTFSVASSNYPALSPTFAVAPVFRVPLYAGKGVAGPKLRTISKKTLAATAEAPELERRGSDGDVVQKPKRLLREQERPSVLRTFSHAVQNTETPSWPPPDVQTMLCQAHHMAGSTQPMTPIAGSPGPTPVVPVPAQVASPAEPERSRSLVSKSLRPILKNVRSVSHDARSPTKESSRPYGSMNRSISTSVLSPGSQAARNGSLDDKALPPLPPPSTPPGVQRIPVNTLRTEHPDGAAPITAEQIKSAATRAAANSGAGTELRSPPSVTSPFKRSGLDRIAGAVLLGKPTTVTKPTGAYIDHGKQLNKQTTVTKLARVATGPTVTSRELSGDSRNNSCSSQASHSTPTVNQPASPAVSAVSNTPELAVKKKKAQPLTRARISGLWEDKGGVSPLSVDFPAGVKV